MNRFFFTVTYLAPDADVGLLSGRCITSLHYFIINHHPFDIGISFPAWTANSLGNIIDFVCEDECKLSRFRENSYFSMMEEEKLFHVCDIAKVGCEKVEEVRFTRNQRIDKLFPGGIRRRLKRAKKRAMERGEIFEPEKLSKPKWFDSFHSSLIESGSTGQSFMLHIQLETGATFMKERERRGFFNSYGLATNQKSRSTVPMRVMAT